MTNAATTDRDAVFAVLDGLVTDGEREIEAELAERSRLEQRMQELAPEAYEGSADAVAELQRVKAELAQLEDRAKLRRLAEFERSARAKAAEDAKLEAERDAFRAEQVEAERDRDTALRVFEKTIAAALDAAADALNANQHAAVLQGKIAAGTGMNYPRLHTALENRLLYLVRARLGDYYIKPGVIIGSQGSEALVSIAPACSVCDHEQREAIEASRADGASLRVLAERFGVGKSTLSEHFRDHA